MSQFNPCRHCGHSPVVTVAPVIGFVLVQCGNSSCRTRQQVNGIIKAPTSKVCDQWNRKNQKRERV